MENAYYREEKIIARFGLLPFHLSRLIVLRNHGSDRASLKANMPLQLAFRIVLARGGNN